MKKFLLITLLCSSHITLFSQGTQLQTGVPIYHLNDSIGIGTSNPGFVLDINGNLRMRNELRLANGLSSFITGFYGASIYRTLDQGSSFPFTQNGNLVLQSRSNASRAITFVTGSTPAARMTIGGTGNVGIGTSNPSDKLHIKSGALQFSEIGHGQDDVDIIKIAENTNNGFFLKGMFQGTGETGNGLKFSSLWNNELLYLRGDGFVGFGTDNPQEKLHIESGAIQFYNLGGSQDDIDIIKIAENTNDTFFLKGMFQGTGGPGNGLKFSSDWNDELLFLRGDGNIGIGTSAPSEKLEVNGNALIQGDFESKKVTVSLSPGNWPDYVFSPKYELPSLNEVEAFINTNQHLPQVPSAKEVAENGQDLGDIQATLLKKIEELTLYMIDMNKQQQSLIEEVKKLKEENKALREKN